MWYVCAVHGHFCCFVSNHGRWVDMTMVKQNFGDDAMTVPIIISQYSFLAFLWYQQILSFSLILLVTVYLVLRPPISFAWAHTSCVAFNQFKERLSNIILKGLETPNQILGFHIWNGLWTRWFKCASHTTPLSPDQYKPSEPMSTFSVIPNDFQ